MPSEQAAYRNEVYYLDYLDLSKIVTPLWTARLMRKDDLEDKKLIRQSNSQFDLSSLRPILGFLRM